jgi:hypothetical protein
VHRKKKGPFNVECQIPITLYVKQGRSPASGFNGGWFSTIYVGDLGSSGTSKDLGILQMR